MHQLPPARWPDRQRWQAYAQFLAVFLLAFIPVYAGSGYLNASWPRQPWRLYLAWETGIPLVPWMVWPYLSLYTVYLLPLFLLDAPAVRRLTMQSVAAVLVAGLVFLLVPAKAGFAAVPVDGPHAPMLRLIAQVDTPFNLVPSLHVTCAALILLACGAAAGGRWRWAALGWLALLATSTVLVHQHHLLDVASGFVLAAAVRRALPLRRGAACAR